MKRALFGRSTHKMRGEKSRSKLIEETDDAMTSAKESSIMSIQEDSSVSEFAMGMRGQSVDGSVISRQEADNLRSKTLPANSNSTIVKDEHKKKKRSSQTSVTLSELTDVKKFEEDSLVPKVAKATKKSSSREKQKVPKSVKSEISGKFAILPAAKGRLPSDYNTSIVVEIMLNPPKRYGAQSFMSHWYDLVICA